MSKILTGLGYARTPAANTQAANYRRGYYTPNSFDANRQPRGTLMQANTTKYTGDHKGLQSFREGAQLNRERLDKMASQQYAGDNAEGILKLAVLDRENDPVPNTPFELGGKTFRTNNQGVARLLDAERLNIELEMHNQIEQYELKILKAIMISDDMALRMLDQEVFNKLRVGGAPENITGAIVQVDARPDVIKFMDPSSVTYGQALVKLKAAVKEAGVILNEENQNLQSATHNMQSPPKQAEVKGTP